MNLLSVEEQIWSVASRLPDKTAVSSGNKSATYRQLCERILGARAYYVDELKCRRGDMILLAAGKQIEFLYAYFGAHLAGLVVAPVDAATNLTRLRYIIEQTKASLLVGFSSDELSLPQRLIKDFDSLNADFTVPEFPSMDAVADILFTTGTTGRPKGVPLTFANEAAAARNINEFVGTLADDVELLALPISHSFGLGRVRCCLSVGATLFLLGGFTNVKKIFRVIEQEHVTGFSMVPASWRYLKKMAGAKLGDYASQLRYVEMGSAYFSAEEKQELADLLPQTRICMHYGLTEASRSAFLEFHADGDALDSVGKASPGTDIKVFDENGDELPSDQQGEICVKGEHVTKGYLGIHADESFFCDYFRTGDWGYKNSDGYIYLAGRKKEMINVGGKKVSPIEVEEQILTIMGVEDCACIGVPDTDGILGEVVKAFIVKSKGCDITFDTIATQLSGKLEAYKLPVCYQWIDEIPKTQNGKKQRELLK